MSVDPPTWLFFDCFNTLVDDFAVDGDTSGLGPLSHLPVESGFYRSEREFRRDYQRWHQARWSGSDWREVDLGERLQIVLSQRDPARAHEIGALVDAMLDAFETGYPATLRPTPGVYDMLEAWRGRAYMGVVSNFFLPGGVERALAQFELTKHFEFVLDSSVCGFKKPGRRIYEEALRLGGVAPSAAGQVLFAGDDLRNDVELPLSLGMRALHLDRSAERPTAATPEGLASASHWDEFRPVFAAS